MSKMDELRRAALGNIDESMGAGRGAVPGEPRPAGMPGPRPVPSRLQGVRRSQDVAEVPVGKIGRDDDQPREEFDPDGIARLAESLKARGQLQPIRVRWDEARDQYVIICGERRWRAAQMAGLATLACVVVDGPMDPAELLAVQLVENALREDLRPVEQARAYRRLMDARGWSARQLADELSVGHPAIVKALALLKLPDSAQALVEDGTIPPSVAYEASKIGDAGEQADVLRRAASGELSRDDVAEAARRSGSRGTAGARGRGAKSRAKPRKVTRKVYRTTAGRVTIENARGIDPDALADALVALADQLRAEGGATGRGAAA